MSFHVSVPKQAGCTPEHSHEICALKGRLHSGSSWMQHLLILTIYMLRAHQHYCSTEA